MAIGPGKYDDVLSVARAMCGSEAAILIVLQGDRGHGFSCQAPLEVNFRLPGILRALADEIEKDLGQLS